MAGKDVDDNPCSKALMQNEGFYYLINVSFQLVSLAAMAIVLTLWK